MECYSSACEVLEDGERFVCRAGTSYKRILFSLPLALQEEQAKVSQLSSMALGC